MSCPSLRQRYDEEKKKGALTFSTVSEIYQDVEGSVAAHKAELEQLMKNNGNPQQIEHLQGCLLYTSRCV